MLDEIYEHINYGTAHFSIARIPELYDRTITVNGVAKAFAMTGWRIGYIGAAEWIAKACNKMQGQITSGANCIAQRATITALLEPVSRIQYMVDEFNTRRDLIIGLLEQIKGEILEIDIDTLTPVEALMKLNEIKRMLQPKVDIKFKN